MKIKQLYDLPTITSTDTYPYEIAKWADHDGMYWFVKPDIDLSQESFNYQDAKEDERIHMELKAYCDLDDGRATVEYYAVSFDGQYVGLVVGVDRPFGWDLEDRFITNFPMYQALTAYIRAVYFGKPEDLIAEEIDIEDLDGRFKTYIDKRFKNHMRQEH